MAGAGAVLVANGWWHATGAHDSLAMEVFADLAAAIAFAAIIASLVLGTGTGATWLGWRPFAWMGEITYGFYLWHIPLLVLARGLGILPSGIVLGLAVLPIAIAFGAASWYWVEQPFMRRAARLPRNAGSGSQRLSRARGLPVQRNPSRGSRRPRWTDNARAPRPASEHLPQPGPDDRVREPEAVADHGRLLRVAVQALRHCHGVLPRGHAALDRLDHELRRVELLLAQHE